MIVRVFPQKDTFVTNVKKRNVPQTGSNFGASEILDLYKVAGVSGAIGYGASSSLARIMMKFDLSTYAALTASGQAPATGTLYFLRMKNVVHSRTVPTSFDIEVAPITKNWDEGSGIDHETFNDKGYANWDKARSNLLWTTPGGDFLTTPTASYHFDSGLEDVDLDVSNIVGAWLTGGLTNNGFVVRLTGSVETDSSDYYIKRFFGRTSSFLDRRPYLEARWDDSLRDDRSTFVYNRTGSLYLYNRVGGQLADLTLGSNTLRVSIQDKSGSLMTVTGSSVGLTGIYSASFAIPTGSSYSGSVFTDRWGSGSYAFMTGTFYVGVDGAVQTNEQSQYVVRVKNIQGEYDEADVVRFNVFVRTRDYGPAVVLTASADVTSQIVRKAFYRIDNDDTQEHVVPFGTGSVAFTRMSYDRNGNYFNVRMDGLHRGNVYRIVFLFDVDGQRQVVDRGFKFRVV